MLEPKYITFDEIANEIINTKEYKSLATQKHHGLTRYVHSIRVAKHTYKVTKKLNLDYVAATKAALLHDFYLDNDLPVDKSFDKIKEHPKVAAQNAVKYFNVSEKEKEAIETHMFPATPNLSVSAEGKILTLVDKSVAIYECGRYKLNLGLTTLLIFMLNLITYTNN